MCALVNMIVIVCDRVNTTRKNDANVSGLKLEEAGNQ